MITSKCSRLSANFCIIACLLTHFIFQSIDAERVSDKIYSLLQSNHYCNRRLNATHQMGCASELGGNRGVVWVINDEDDLKHVLETGPTPPYMAILTRPHFTRRNLLQFKSQPDRVNGVVFLNANREHLSDTSIRFSPDDVCPNRYSGLYANSSKSSECAWQLESPISGILQEDIPFPIFMINDKTSAGEIDKCFKTHNLLVGEDKKRQQNSYPLCSIQLDSFMTAAQNAETCLNSHSLVDELLQTNGQRCRSVDNENIFAYYKTAQGPLQSINGTSLMAPGVAEKQSIVMLAAKLSSLSMFTDISPGADSTITSIVTMLSVADALAKVKSRSEVNTSKRNIAFALFDSEPYDYTGSSRVIYNMERNVFPFGLYEIKRLNLTTLDAMLNTNLTSIDYVINLDQLASYAQDTDTHFHSHPGDKKSEKLKTLYNLMERLASEEKIKLQREDPDLMLPFASVQQFIKATQQANGDKLLGVVVSNYGKSYNNRFYNSIYDDVDNVYQTSKTNLVAHISRVARFVARTIYELTFKTDKTDFIRVDESLIGDMFDCYLKDAQCALFTRAWQAGHKLPSGPIQTYKDPTKRSDDMNGAITSHLLAYLIGDRVNELNLTQCHEENRRNLTFNFEYINGLDEPIVDETSGVCIRSQVTVLSAQSPAYSRTEDAIVINPKYPAWTVSHDGIRNPARLYLKPSPVYEWLSLLLGALITIVSVVITLRTRDTVARINKTNGDPQAATPT